MESLDSRDAVLELILDAAGRGGVPRRDRRPGVVLQAYLRDSPATLDTIVGWIDAGRARSARTR